MGSATAVYSFLSELGTLWEYKFKIGFLRSLKMKEGAEDLEREVEERIAVLNSRYTGKRRSEL
ncbi:MAG: hypothetical protein QXO76_01945 [Thermoproteota archaeon]